MKRAAVTTAIALGLAACGGPGGPGDAPATAHERAVEDAQIAFARCMREQGVDHPDPRRLPDGTYAQSPPKDPVAFERGAKACGHLLHEAAEADLSAGEQRELQESIDRDRALARCLRERGLRWPDPIPGRGGFRLRDLERNGIDPEDPAVETAQRACRGR